MDIRAPCPTGFDLVLFGNLVAELNAGAAVKTAVGLFVV